MAKEIAGIRIVVLRESGQLFEFTNVMEHGSRQQQVPVQNRICLGKIVTVSGDADSMLQKSSHEAMVHAFCGRMEFELFFDGRIFEKGT